MKKWNSLICQLQTLNSVSIPRCYFHDKSGNLSSVELHCFSEASEKAYAAVVYLRSTYEDGRIEVNLVASKTRVAPLKKQSIPRLELLGATILVRLAKAVQNALPPEIGIRVLGRFHDCVVLDKECQTVEPIRYEQGARNSRTHSSGVVEILSRQPESSR